MCKPGAACCTCGTASSGIGVAVGVVAAATLVSVASTVITDILTAVLVGVFTFAAAAGVLLVITLWRTRGVATRPRAARQPVTAVMARVVPPPRALPATPAVDGRSLTPPRPARAIEAPGPRWAGVPGEPERAPERLAALARSPLSRT